MSRPDDSARPSSLYIAYWGLEDPLCQTQSLAYLRRLTRLGHRFLLITFEQPRYRLDKARAAEARGRLAAEGIAWHPLRYGSGRYALAKSSDFVRCLALGLYLCLRYRPRIVHSRASLPAPMAAALAWACRLKFLYDADSRLSEEYADIGHWRRDGLPYRLTAWSEALARRRADSVVVLTEPSRAAYVGEFGVVAPVAVIPCCVDLDLFRFDPAARASRRGELGVGGERLLVYVGKTGSWYLVGETFEFFKAARGRLGGVRLLIVSTEPRANFDAVAARHGLAPGDFDVRSADRRGVVEWLSAADAGLSLISRLPSKRGSSPVKAGEYLAVGLPVVITDGIGDYSDWVERDRVGVVLASDSPESYRRAVDRLEGLWSEGDGLRERCRRVALERVDLERVGVCRYHRVYDDLLGRPPRGRANTPPTRPA